MHDAAPEIEAKMKELIMTKSGEERLIMGCSMFSFARKMALASILEEYGDNAPPGIIKKELFLRFYDRDMDRETLDKVTHHLENLE